jgi:p-aminobenzoyl-glutamate transporter AbgT
MKLQLKNPMSTEQYNELKQTIEMASQGDYVPLLLIAGVIIICFLTIVAVIVGQYKRDQTENKEVQKLSIQNAKILSEHNIEIKNLKERMAV